MLQYVIISLGILLLIPQKAISQADYGELDSSLHIEVEASTLYDSNKDTSTIINIIYTNKSEHSVFFWLKNWRIILLRNDLDWFFNYPSHNELVNYCIIYSDSVNIDAQTPLALHSGRIWLMDYPYSIKKIPSKDRFTVSVISDDKELIEFLEGGNYKVKMISPVSTKLEYSDATKERNSQSLFWRSNSLHILFPSIEYSGNGNTNMYDFRLTRKGEAYQLDKLPIIKNSSFFHSHSTPIIKN